MYKICKNEKTVARQKQFQNTLLIMMETQNLHDITVTSLCKEMGAPRNVFYRYFDVLEDVLYSLMDDVLTEAFLFFEEKAEIEKFFHYWSEKKDLLDILLKNDLSSMLINRAYSLQFSKEIKIEMNVKQMRYSCAIAGIMALLIIWHHNGMKQTPKEMKELLLSVLPNIE